MIENVKLLMLKGEKGDKGDAGDVSTSQMNTAIQNAVDAEASARGTADASLAERISNNEDDIAEHENEINALQTLTTVEDLSADLTLSANVQNAVLLRFGKVYFLRFEIKGSFPATSWDTVFTMPNAYAPASDVACSKSNYNTADAGKLAEVVVRSNAQVRAYLVTAISSYGVIDCSATWIKA